MEDNMQYCFVVDKNDRPLAPTKVSKGWYLIRKGRAGLKSKYPMVIQLEKEVEADEGETANKRIEWNIEKSHANDAVCITDCMPDTCSLKEWIIKPIRRRSKAGTDNVLGIRHRDLVEYTYKNGETHRGYVTALYPELFALNFQSPTKHCKKVNAHKCRLLWKYDKIYWLDTMV